MKNHKQQGTAIVIALFVTALVAAIAVAMIERLHIDTRRTELLLNNIQANLAAQGSVAWAIDQLLNDIKQKQPTKVIDPTPIRSTVNKINGATIWSVIYDAQGKLNINNLVDPTFQDLFARLLHLVEPTLTLSHAKIITQGISDWITPSNTHSSFDADYAKQSPPYRASHRPLFSISELRLVKGITPALYRKLAPYTTALPEQTPFNINSIPALLLVSLSPAIQPETAKSFTIFRQQKPLVNLDQMNQFAILRNNPIGQNKLTVTSNYFLAQTHIIQGTQHAVFNTLLMRLVKDSQPRVIILWQSQGTL